VPVCTKCGQDNPDVARFCLACGSSLAAPEPTAEERKLVTVLFCDIVGSTATAEQLDPEDVRARLAPYYERVRAELERFGGTVEKFIGDAVVALFGAPVAHEDDPERAVRAALAVRAAIAELNAEDEWLDLKIRVGINTGEALVVLGARPSEGEGMAAGDVMNTAARLQSAAPVNGIVVGELTHRATRYAVEYIDV
jgi:class 3 adenylate cyclase